MRAELEAGMVVWCRLARAVRFGVNDFWKLDLIHFSIHHLSSQKIDIIYCHITQDSVEQQRTPRPMNESRGG